MTYRVFDGFGMVSLEQTDCFEDVGQFVPPLLGSAPLLGEAEALASLLLHFSLPVDEFQVSEVVVRTCGLTSCRLLFFKSQDLPEENELSWGILDVFHDCQVIRVSAGREPQMTQVG